mgnify:CR=1 FL=1
MEIRVTCSANSTIDLDQIYSLQGDLKSLSEEDFEKLKKSILRYGISFPIFLWQQKDKARILDGTQRDKVLKKMREEGYKIPSLPVDLIEAKDETEAKEKILLISSQYGRMTDESFKDFLAGSMIDFPVIEGILALPQIDTGSHVDIQNNIENVWEQAIQLKPPRQYVLVICDDDNGEQFDVLKELLELKRVRRGGYKKGTAFDAVGTQRVIPAAEIITKLNAHRNSKQRPRRSR